MILGQEKYPLLSYEVYEKTMTAFDALPIAAVVDRKVFCAHGGLSPHIRTLADIALVSFISLIMYINRLFFTFSDW